MGVHVINLQSVVCQRKTFWKEYPERTKRSGGRRGKEGGRGTRRDSIGPDRSLSRK